MVIGVDEVGRGAWAGPLLVVAARAIAELPVAVTDSKLLSRQQRERMFADLQRSCGFGEGWVEPYEIDRLGLTQSMKLAVARALTQLKAVHNDQIIMDGHINYCPDEFTNVQCIVKADLTHPIVSVASIYAKVTRDRKMSELGLEHPGYGFEKHVGYGTKLHLEALKTFGLTPLHRLSYKPVKAFI